MRGIRYINNFDELVYQVRINYKKYKWEELKTHVLSIYNSVRYYSSVKLMVCAMGSNAVNCMWMREHTGISLISFSDFDILLELILQHKIFVFIIKQIEWIHTDKHPRPINISITLTGIKHTLYAIQNLYGQRLKRHI